MSAPKGNRNAAKAKIWELAVRHELGKDRQRLYNIANKVLNAAEAGEAWAVTEIRNTLDGKPSEHVVIDQEITVNVGESEALTPKLDKLLSRRSSVTVQ